MSVNTSILSIDQGTTSSRAILFDLEGSVLQSSQQPFAQYFPENGWVEHNPEEIWESVQSTCKEVLGKCDQASWPAAIGITNQRETTLVWNRKTGRPIYPAIVWQDRRTTAFCNQLKGGRVEELIRSKTGLLPDPYFSASKIRWILENVEGARASAERGDLAFGTVDTWLVWKLTEGRRHVTDITNASRTLLFDIHRQHWDSELLKLFDIPENMLPEVLDNAADFGDATAAPFSRPVAIRGSAGDQQAALVGQYCLTAGTAKSTYGTGCFLVINTGKSPLRSSHNLLTTIGFRVGSELAYAVEGSIFMAGATVQWLRDNLSLREEGIAGDKVSEVADLSLQDEVYLVPAFTGLGAPYWIPEARGAISGLTRDTSARDIVHASLQSVAYQTQDLLMAMQADGIEEMESLRIDGGMTANESAMQFLSDIIDMPVERPQNTETTAWGAALLAAIGSGNLSSLSESVRHRKVERIFKPTIHPDRRISLYNGWKAAISGVIAQAATGNSGKASTPGSVEATLQS